MAAPSISVVRTPAGVVTPGTQITFTVTATDADARSVVYTFDGTDLAGNPARVTETVVVSDPVAIAPGVEDPAGTAEITQDGVDPRVYRSTV